MKRYPSYVLVLTGGKGGDNVITGTVTICLIENTDGGTPFHSMVDTESHSAPSPLPPDRPIASLAFHAGGELVAVASGHKVSAYTRGQGMRETNW